MKNDDQPEFDPKRAAEIVQALEAIGLSALTTEEARRAFSRDASLYQAYPLVIVQFPDALVASADDAHLASIMHDIVDIARRQNVRLTFVGSRTSVAGQAINQQGILVDMASLNRPGMLSTAPVMQVETPPGVILDTLNMYTRGHRDRFTPGYEHSLDLSSSYMASIGGAIMNNGGGILATKYGSARDNVLDLHIALPDGRTTWTSAIQEHGACADIYHSLLDMLVQTGPERILQAQPHLRKYSCGYNLRTLAEQARDRQPLDVTQLFVGSEGTLGALLRARVKVRPVADPTETVLVFFASLAQMSQAVQEILRIEVDGKVITPRALEVISGSIFGIIDELGDLGRLGDALPEASKPPSNAHAAALLIEYDNAAPIARAALAKVRAICERYIPPSGDGSQATFRVVHDATQRANFWFLRKNVVEILNHYGRKHGLFAPPIIEDIGVPVEHLGNLIAFLQREMDALGWRCAIFGHAGDGNLHVRPLLKPDQEHVEIAHHLMDVVYRYVISLGGTISAEHGDGLLRTPYLELQYGPQVNALFRQIKELFDPHYIFNPGVKVPPPNWPAERYRAWAFAGFAPTGGGRSAFAGAEDRLPPS